MNSTVLPVLDLRQLYGSAEHKALFLQELAEAARSVGFFYISGHALCAQKNELLTLSERFFALPDTQKRSVEMKNTPHFRGYTRLLGELTQGKPDQREQFDIMNEQAALPFIDINEPWQHLIGPNQWPAELPELREKALAYQAAQTTITVDLLTAFAEALGQPANAFTPTLGTPYTHMKLIRYPGASRAALNSGQGVGAHKDPGYITIVSQDSESGLEVELDDKGWVAVPPLEGTLVVNIGELLELASDGYLRATNHRVVTPATGRERYSIAFFMAAQLDSTVPLLALPEALKQQALGPSSDPNNPLFYNVGENVVKGRIRSHPDAAERWGLSAGQVS